MVKLFNSENIDTYIRSLEHQKPPEEPIIRILTPWIAIFNERSSESFTEENLEQSFNSDFFIKMLEYIPPPNKVFTILTKGHTLTERGFPDFLLGNFSISGLYLKTDKRVVVGELKRPGVDLDKIDASRGISPVEQGLKYAQINGTEVAWALISNMETIRLYSIIGGPLEDYEEFKVINFIENGTLSHKFWEFYFLLHSNY